MMRRFSLQKHCSRRACSAKIGQSKLCRYIGQSKLCRYIGQSKLCRYIGQSKLCRYIGQSKLCRYGSRRACSAATCFPCFIFFASCFFASFVFAADLGEIEVTAPDETPRYDESASSRIITPKREEIKTTTEIIEQSPGIHVKRYGSNEDSSVISIRGAPANQIAVFYDNVPLTGAAGNTVDLSMIPPENIGRIEIYRGGTPAKAPDPSSAGAIFITTPARPDKLKIKLQSGYGSFGTFKGNVNLTQPVGGSWYLVSFDHSQSRGDFKYIDDNGTRTKTSDDTIRRRQNNDYTSENLLTKYGWGNEAWGIEASNTFFTKRQGVPGLGLFKSAIARLNTDRNITIVNGSHKNTKATLFFDYLNSRFSDPKGDIGLGRQDNSDYTFRFGEELSQGFKETKFGRIYAALTHRGEFFQPNNYAAAVTRGTTSWRQQAGIALEDSVSLFSERLLLAPSFRFNAIFNHLSSNDPSIVSGIITTNERRDYQLTGKFGLKLRLFSELYLKGNFYRGFRNPDFTELFGDRGTIVGNPSLKPEESLNMDAGIGYDASGGGWLDRLKAEAVYFRSSTKNLIQFLQTSQMTARPENISSSLIQGFEGLAQFAYLRHFSHSLSYTFQSAVDTGGTMTDGKTLPGRPRHELWIDTSVYNEWGKVYGEYNFMGGNYLDTQNILEVTGRHFVNAGLSAVPAKWVTLSFTVKNITNDQTFDVIGFPLPGRSYWGMAVFSI